MNPDQRHDEDREQAMIDEINAKEADATMAHFRERGFAVSIAIYPSTVIRGIDLTHEELAKHPRLTPQRVADLMSEHTGGRWVVTKVEPKFRLEPGDHGYPNLPFEGVRVMLTKTT